MKKSYLLNTHALIWLLEGNELLPLKPREVIADTENYIFTSIVTLW